MSIQEKDEAFWQKQQKRREKRLGQPCCTQSGISWSMMHIPGRFAVIVHGEKDCLNCFHHHTGVSSHQFYSTRLSDAQLTMGTTEEALRECVSLIAKEQRPELILVLGTCPVEVIGANFLETVEDLSQEIDIPIIALKTSGLKLSSQSEMLDWLYEVLAGLDQKPRIQTINPKDTQKLRILWKRAWGIVLPESYPEAGYSINLFGLPASRTADLSWIFSFLGIHTLSFPEQASLDNWKQLQAAKATFLTDTAIFPRFLKKMAASGAPAIEIPVPVGLESTEKMLLNIARFCERESEAKTLLQQILPRLNTELREIQKQYEGKTFALILRMRNTVQLDAIAQGGLGMIPFVRELGGRLTLYIQGAPDPEVKEAYQRILQEKGIQLPFFIFSSPYSLSEMLKQEQYSLVFGPDQGAQAAARAGRAYLDFGNLTSGFSGLRKNWTLVAEAMK